MIYISCRIILRNKVSVCLQIGMSIVTLILFGESTFTVWLKMPIDYRGVSTNYAKSKIYYKQESTVPNRYISFATGRVDVQTPQILLSEEFNDALFPRCML